jgi:hypothetical protein
MGGRNQKITAFLLLVLILAPLSYMFILQSRQQRIRQRMKYQLEQSLLQDIVMPAAELQWFKPGKEIVIDNQLFDIKCIRYGEDGNAYISGLFDKEETILVYAMKKDWNEQNRNSSRQVIQLFKMIQSIPEPDQLLLAPLTNTESPKTMTGNPFLPAGFTSISTPPPQG